MFHIAPGRNDLVYRNVFSMRFHNVPQKYYINSKRPWRDPAVPLGSAPLVAFISSRSQSLELLGRLI